MPFASPDWPDLGADDPPSLDQLQQTLAQLLAQQAQRDAAQVRIAEALERVADSLAVLAFYVIPPQVRHDRA